MLKTLLIVDDDTNIIASLKFLLGDENLRLITAQSPKQALEILAKQPVDLVLTDMNFEQDTTSGNEGLGLIKNMLQQEPQLPVIVMTGWATIDLAVEALKSGARDFIQKPWDDERLILTLKTQLRVAAAENQARRLTSQNQILSAEQHPLNRDSMIAESIPMRQLLDSIEQLAQSDMNVLFTGDNGTGKSMLAHYLHRVSPRNKRSFVSVNMGAISENLFESEMFGHIKGAFTDAKENRIGRFEMAEGGTLFLDELANIPVSQQAKLLRVLESHQFEPVGSSKTFNADVRVVSATNANFEALIAERTFRQDLYYRLNTVELRVPSLSERTQDIPLLAEMFLNRYCEKYQKQDIRLSTRAVQQLIDYQWPGNVREMSHVIERALFTCKRSEIESFELLTKNTRVAPQVAPISQSLTLEQIEQQALEQRLEYFQGNVSETAKSLGLSRSGYYRRMNKYNQD